jgi:hypothetical protein
VSQPANNIPLRPIAIVMASAFAVTFASQAYVQVIASDKVKKQAEEARRGAQEIPLVGSRGTIFDRQGVPVASNGAFVSLAITRGRVPETDAFWLAVSEASGVPSGEIAAKVTGLKLGRTASWSLQMANSQMDELQAVKKEWRADGLSAARTSDRYWSLGAAGSNLIGWIDKQKDGLVKTELEFSQDSVLKPENGHITAFLDRRGYVLPNRIVDPGKPAKNGASLRLTIDAEIQRTAYESLKRVVMREGVDGAAAVVMNPRTGAILAATSFPSVDPMTGSYEGFAPKFANKPQTMVIEAGSTFKILSLAIALEEKKTSLHEPFFCTGALKVSGHTMHCDLSHGPHGHTDSTGAIAVSCNMAAAKWAMEVGPDKFQSYFKRLGVLAKPGIFGPDSEKFGDFYDDDYSKLLQIATVGFGQNIKATPIALATAFCTIANDGIRPIAHLVERVGDLPAEMPKPLPRPRDAREGNGIPADGRIFSPEVCREVRDAMVEVFESEHGTGKKLKIPGYRLAGKTGTAETGVDRQGRSANFIGFVPAENPQAVVLVMIQNKRRKFYGGTYAGPVFQDIAVSAIEQLKIPPSGPAAYRAWRDARAQAQRP